MSLKIFLPPSPQQIPAATSDQPLPGADARLTNSQLTAAEENGHWRRLNQLVEYTRGVMGHKYILLGDNASQLAARCLAGVAQGRGGSIGTEMVRLQSFLKRNPPFCCYSGICRQAVWGCHTAATNV